MSSDELNSIDWQPRGRGGRSITTFKLRKINKDLMRFKPTIQYMVGGLVVMLIGLALLWFLSFSDNVAYRGPEEALGYNCLLYTSPSPRDATLSRMPSSA